MTWNSTREGELPKEFFHPDFILRDLRIGLRICALEVRLSNERRTSMTWARNIDHLQFIPLDQPIEMRIKEI